MQSLVVRMLAVARGRLAMWEARFGVIGILWRKLRFFAEYLSLSIVRASKTAFVDRIQRGKRCHSNMRLHPEAVSCISLCPAVPHPPQSLLQYLPIADAQKQPLRSHHTEKRCVSDRSHVGKVDYCIEPTSCPCANQRSLERRHSDFMDITRRWQGGLRSGVGQEWHEREYQNCGLEFI